MSPEEYQELGRRYYKLKQYEKAIETFTHGIESAPTTSLYDHRAAAYDRLDNYDAAIRDGRSMIKHDKQDVRGYLRTASVLEKMGKLETALGIYKYGMKNVPVGDKNFKLLQQLHDKMTRQLSPAKSIDPLTVLPVELAEMVLEYLTFRNIVNCMRTSRGWKAYIAKLPRLWMHLDLSGARRPVSRSFINQAVRRSQNRLAKATIHRFEHVDVLKNVAKCCKELADLEFISLPHAMSSTLIEIVQCAPNLKRFVVHPEISPDTVSQIVRHRPNLEHVGFNTTGYSRYTSEWKGPFPALKSLSMNTVKGRSGDNMQLELLLQQTPVLEVLGLTQVCIRHTAFDFASLPLTSLILRQVHFMDGQHFPVFPASMQTLVFEAEIAVSMKRLGNSLLHSRLPALKHLTLTNILDLNASAFSEFLDLYWSGKSDDPEVALEGATPLQSLTLRGLHQTPSDGLFRDTTGILAQSPRILTPALKSLDIATMPCDDTEIEHLLSYDTGLTSIDLSSTQISGASIKMLVDKLSKLKTIRADNCLKISGRDAIEYARVKGVTVHCSMNEGKGSKRIRYG